MNAYVIEEILVKNGRNCISSRNCPMDVFASAS